MESILNHITSKHCNANDFHAAKQAVRKKYKLLVQIQVAATAGLACKRNLYKSAADIRLSIIVKLLTCISLNGPSSGSIMAAALGEP